MQTTPLKRVEQVIADLIESRDNLRATAKKCHDEGDMWDSRADALTAQIGDWEVVRHATRFGAAIEGQAS